MIKFFKKIRQNLLLENKTGKYLKYAIGEIILVVIGILIALQLNAWKEEINAKEELKTSMNSMLDDLSQDISFYNTQIEKIENRVLLLNDFSQGNYSEIIIETIPDILSYNVQDKNFGTTYISLKEDRQFNRIKNIELKKKITAYYEVFCKEYSGMATWHKKFVTETIESYMLLNLPYKKGFKVDANDVLDDLENGKLLSIIYYQISIQEHVLGTLKNHKLLAEEMRLFINSEFN